MRHGLGCSLLLFASQTWAASVMVSVPGTASPFLAGMPAGMTCCINDSAPGQSPMLVSFPLTTGDALIFTATGMTRHGNVQPFVDADGRPALFELAGPENGLGGLNAQLSSLVGVFLDDAQPDLTAAPPVLDFSMSSGMDFTILTPELKQVFFVGNGRTSSNQVQRFIVPVGATRLYLGTMDGFEWNNNEGALSVTVSDVPEPFSGSLIFAALALMGILRARMQCTSPLRFPKPVLSPARDPGHEVWPSRK